MLDVDDSIEVHRMRDLLAEILHMHVADSF